MQVIMQLQFEKIQMGNKNHETLSVPHFTAALKTLKKFVKERSNLFDKFLNSLGCSCKP